MNADTFLIVYSWGSFLCVCVMDTHDKSVLLFFFLGVSVRFSVNVCVYVGVCVLVCVCVCVHVSVSVCVSVCAYSAMCAC